MEYKLVRLRNVKLRIAGCTDSLDHTETIKDNLAVIETHSMDYRIRLNGNEVSLDSMPTIIENGTLEILNEDADIIIYYPEKNRICKGFTDGEYAYMACINVDFIVMLLMSDLIYRCMK